MKNLMANGAIWYNLTMMKLTERPEKIILDMLEAAGYEGYFAGGCVRDEIMRETAGIEGRGEAVPDGEGDIDVTTNALPDEVKDVFNGWKTVDTGIAHGTVTVIMPFSGSRVEITTYRRDGGYSDSRHPDSVDFISSLREDLKRRDFTMNAMAMDARGRIVDPFGGREDLAGGIIRAVGDPEERFSEDGLRIARAVRFAAAFGFDMEPLTRRAAFEKSGLLENISAERLLKEFMKTLKGSCAGQAVRRYVDILRVFIPELGAMKGFSQKNPYHRYDVLEHCIRTMEAVVTTKKNTGYMRMAALFHDMGKPATCTEDMSGMRHFRGHGQAGAVMADKMLRRLRADGSMRKRVVTIIGSHGVRFERDRAVLKRLMERFTPEVTFEILELKKADNLATGNMSGELMKKFVDAGMIMEDIIARGECFTLRDMAVGGEDIISAGIEKGPRVGMILRELLRQVIDGDVPNEKGPLMEAALKLGKKDDIIYRS